MPHTRRSNFARALVGAWVALMLAAPRVGEAAGYQLQRYEPTPASESFFAVQFPWYSQTRRVAFGLTVDGGQDVLVGGAYDPAGRFHQAVSIVSTQLVGHLDVAFSLFDRLQLSGSLPVTLMERGTPGYAVAPISGSAVGDPRITLTGRLFGRAEEDPISLHLSAALWIPVGAHTVHAGDENARGLFRVIVGGRPLHYLQWAANAGVFLRRAASLDASPGGPGTAGSELQISGAMAYVTPARRFTVGPELLFATGMIGPRAFRRDSMSMEVILGANYLFAQQIQVGAGVGFGVLRSVGTPAVRPMLRLAYAPKFSSRQMGSALVQTAPPPPEEPVAVAKLDPEVLPPSEPVAAVQEEQPAVPECSDGPAAGQRRVNSFMFRFNSDAVSAETERSIQALAKTMKADPGARLHLSGYTDEFGPESFNMDLSARRALTVERILLSSGVSREQIVSRGLGPRKPCPSGEAKRVHAQDRRVDADLMGGQ